MNISSIRPIINYGKRILKVYPDAAIGFNTDIIGKAMRETKGDVWTRAKAGFHAIENDVAVKSAAEGNFFKRIYKNIVGMPSTIKTSAKEGFEAAKAAEKSGIWGGIKGATKGFGKAMPFLFAGLTILGSLPNAITATKEQGIGQGIAELGKTAARLGGGAVGAAIGSALLPPVGGFIGWFVGDWLTGKVVGKSYTEKKEEVATQLAQAQPYQQMSQMGQPMQPAFSGGMTNPLYNYQAAPTQYDNDIMMKNFNVIA
ncbi:MAG: hypothetical protein UDK34_08755 [Cyanobacteriota bacterium]|jgi:hypothetical protein|nr:hypothetical protein [Cyanobacteriota bacterium]